MTFDLFLRFRISGTRNEVNRIFRSIHFAIQLEHAFLYDPFSADSAETRMQNSLCFIWKDLRASSLDKAKELVDFQLQKMLSHLPARISCQANTLQRPTILGDIFVEVQNEQSKTGTPEGNLH